MNLLVKQLEMSAACLQMANRAFESNMRLAQVMMTSAFESAKLLSPVGPVRGHPGKHRSRSARKTGDGQAGRPQGPGPQTRGETGETGRGETGPRRTGCKDG